MPSLKPDGSRLNGVRSGHWISDERRRAIYRRDGWECRYCSRSLRNAPSRMRTLDHIIPVVDGGTHDDVNLLTCCKSCNDRKQHKTVWVLLDDAPLEGANVGNNLWCVSRSDMADVHRPRRVAATAAGASVGGGVGAFGVGPARRDGSDAPTGAGIASSASNN
jgi:hypothetical protein